MNDDELRDALARRAAGSLSADERNDLLRSARLEAVEPRRRSFLPRLAGSLAGAAVLLVLVVLIAPTFLTSPAARPSGSAAAPGSVRASISPGVTIYSTQELANMVGDPNWVGKTVLAEAGLDVLSNYGLCPPPAEPCVRAALQGVARNSGVLVGWRDATEQDGVRSDSGNGFRWVKQIEVPTQPGVFAFTIRDRQPEYLGPAHLSPPGEPVTVADVQRISSTVPRDDVTAVHGWLTKNWPPPPCAAPPEMLESPRPALDYYCYGTWLTAKPSDDFSDGVRVDNDAYEFFAVSPHEDENGVSPQEGVYLVRNGGCPKQAPCPAWRLVGRLDTSATAPIAPSRPVSPGPPTTPIAPSASPSAAELVPLRTPSGTLPKTSIVVAPVVNL